MSNDFSHSTAKREVNLYFIVSDGKGKIAALIQGDAIARGPKLLSIKHYVIEIIT
jgi:hypothetical protein